MSRATRYEINTSCAKIFEDLSKGDVKNKISCDFLFIEIIKSLDT